MADLVNTSSIATVKKFIDAGSSVPTTSQELMAFWKSCTDAEKLDFTRGSLPDPA